MEGWGGEEAVEVAAVSGVVVGSRSSWSEEVVGRLVAPIAIDWFKRLVLVKGPKLSKDPWPSHVELGRSN